MARRPSPHPTDGELEILQILWKLGPSELGDIRARLQQDRRVATTTVATMLKVMAEKRLVRRSSGTRRYLYAARVSRKAVSTRLVRTLVDRMFDGSAKRLVAHLLQSRKLSDADRDSIRRLLSQTDDD